MDINSTGTKAYVDNTSTTAVPSLQSIYNPPRPRGEVGWICPVCGRGNAPSTAYCNCNITKPDIVYATGGLTVKSVLDEVIDCKGSYDTTTSISSSGNDKGCVYGKSTYTN